MELSDNQIQNDIEALKTRFTNTQELYREVAALLFFRYGLTPTANKLYQLVRKGSMSAPAEALNRFWAELREKSRVRITLPNLPESLSSKTGELLGTLWEEAQAYAQDALSHMRSNIEAELASLRVERDTSQAAATACQREVVVIRDELAALRQVATDLENRCAAESAEKLMLETRLAAADQERNRLQITLKESRESFGHELAKIRESLKTIEDRADAETKRHLLQIDRERTLASKAQRELNAIKSEIKRKQTQSQTEISKLQIQLSNLKEASGKLQGQLAEVKTQLSSAKRELASALKIRKSNPKSAKKTV